MSEERHLFRRLLKCVTFIFAKQGKEYKPIGTGFFVNNKVGKGFFNYFVTANHVLESGPDIYYDTVHMRYNNKEGKAEFFEINFEDMKKETGITIHRHPDKTVDLATFMCSPPRNLFDILPLSADTYFATNEIIERRSIAEGDEVLFVGLFSHRYGVERNEPIMRFGRVSLMPTSKTQIELKDRSPYDSHVYLFECQSLGAFSGAPVFYMLNPSRYSQFDKEGIHGLVHYLAGVMVGHYNELRIEDNDSKIREMHEGIALVTPAQYLHELMQTEPIQAELKKWAAHHNLL